MKPNKSKEEMAEKLATAHYNSGNGVKEIFRLVSTNNGEACEEEPVVLLEINEDTIPVGIEPVYFGTHPASGIVHPFVVVAVTPEEFTQQMKEELTQKYGWKIGHKYERPRKRRIA